MHCTYFSLFGWYSHCRWPVLRCHWNALFFVGFENHLKRSHSIAPTKEVNIQMIYLKTNTFLWAHYTAIIYIMWQSTFTCTHTHSLGNKKNFIASNKSKMRSNKIRNGKWNCILLATAAASTAKAHPFLFAYFIAHMFGVHERSIQHFYVRKTEAQWQPTNNLKQIAAKEKKQQQQHDSTREEIRVSDFKKKKWIAFRSFYSGFMCLIWVIFNIYSTWICCNYLRLSARPMTGRNEFFFLLLGILFFDEWLSLSLFFLEIYFSLFSQRKFLYKLLLFNIVVTIWNWYTWRNLAF